MIAIIFGVSGQDGFYLKQLCERNSIKVVGVSRNLGYDVTGNISDFNLVKELVKTLRPAYVFHLAANSSTRHDFVFENHETISTGTLNVLESVYQYSKHTRVFISGSALQFLNTGNPINETDPFSASSPYSVSRIQSVYAARYYSSLGVLSYIGYFFNHDSPLRSERHVNQKIVKAAKRIAAGSKEKLEVGDISVRKEFLFAGDVVEAIFALVRNDNIFETVIGSGKDYSIQDWLDACFDHYNIDWQSIVSFNPTFKKEYDRLVSDPSTIFKLGWRPTTGFKQLAEIMLNAN